MKPVETRGFTLIEALVALLVLSVGVLGLAAMQLKASQGATIAYQRSLASLVALDGEERIWRLLAEHDAEVPWHCPTDIGDVAGDWLTHWQDTLSFLDGDVSTYMAYVGDSGRQCTYIADVTWRNVSQVTGLPECLDFEEDADGNLVCTEFAGAAESLAPDSLLYRFRVPGEELSSGGDA